MPKPVSVYAFFADPACDFPLFRITRSDAAARIAKGYVRPLSHDVVQTLPPPGYVPGSFQSSGLFQSAWHIKPSDHYLVWQLRPTLSDTENV